MSIWQIFPRFGIFHPEKIWQPCAEPFLSVSPAIGFSRMGLQMCSFMHAESRSEARVINSFHKSHTYWLQHNECVQKFFSGHKLAINENLLAIFFLSQNC
jgi:hypothetical protein